MAERKIRVLAAKPGLDGHDRGIKVISRGPAGRGHGSYLYRSAPDPGTDRQRRHAGGRGCHRHELPLRGA